MPNPDLSLRPTAISYGDSISLGYAGNARYFLWQQVDFRHNIWHRENLDPSQTDAFISDEVRHGINDGYSTRLLQNMEQELDDRHYNVLLYNSGLHDLQLTKTGHMVPLPQYRYNMEAVATLAEQHADYVIWVRTTDIPPGIPAGNQFSGLQPGDEIPYNAVGDEIAREHGFYILNITDGSHPPGSVHFYHYKNIGRQVAQCVLDVLAAQESATCYK